MKFFTVAPSVFAVSKTNAILCSFPALIMRYVKIVQNEREHVLCEIVTLTLKLSYRHINDCYTVDSLPLSFQLFPNLLCVRKKAQEIIPCHLLKLHFAARRQSCSATSYVYDPPHLCRIKSSSSITNKKHVASSVFSATLTRQHKHNTDMITK